MNLDYLGDALDHWKGSIFESLKISNILRDFAVDPMAKDWPCWKGEDVLAFTRLLRIDKAQLISHTTPITSRGQYFSEISHVGDLFLDPDTGVATGRVSPKHKYVWPAEVGMLLGDSDRLVAIYQHGSRTAISERVGQVCRALIRDTDGIGCCSYESGSVAMIFVSLSSKRIHDVTECFRGVLGSAFTRRIRTCGRLE